MNSSGLLTSTVRLASGGSDDRGAQCVVTVVPPNAAVETHAAGRIEDAPGNHWLACPLLAILTVDRGTLLAVGQLEVMQTGRAATVTLIVKQLWLAESHAPTSTPQGWRSVQDDPGLPVALLRFYDRIPHVMPDDPSAALVQLTKAMAEHSRNAVQELREQRYALERRLGLHIRRELETGKLELLLADIVELASAASRARDEARAAVREGLWMWRHDDAAYHAHRQMLDPTLPVRPAAAAAHQRPWFRAYDAGMRQCMNLRQECSEEAESRQALLNSGASIAMARDASAQETFNLLASVGAVAFGLPALVLALYSASSLPPFNSPGRLMVLLPLLLTGLISVGVAVKLPGEIPRRQRIGYALAFVFTTLCVLALAGFLFRANRI